MLRLALVCAYGAILSGCGGGGGGGGVDAPVSLPVTLSASSASATVMEGATASTFTLTATMSGTAKTPIVPNVSYDKAVFEDVTVVAGATAGTYTLTARTLPDLPGATYSSALTFRLCQEAACTNVYNASTATYTHNLTVKLKEWAMFQRDAAHTGYVHTVLDVTKFTKAWSYTRNDAGFTNPVIAANGSAFVSLRWGKVISLNEATGAVNWTSDLQTPTALNTAGDLAYQNGRVYVPAFVTIPGSTFYGTASIRALDAATGTFISDSGFISQVSEFNSPAFDENSIYYTQGYYGGSLFGYDLATGASRWTPVSNYSNIYGGQSPAVDKNYVYQSSSWGLLIHDKTSGAVVASVSEPRLYSTSYSERTGPVVTPAGRVLYLNRDAGQKIFAVDVANRSVAWRSQTGYNLQPVVSGETVYASRNYPASVDALDEKTGAVLWSWSAPSGEYFSHSMIVCDNLLFISSNKMVYAVDLKTRQTVWTYPATGPLSLSSGYMLYIAGNQTFSIGSPEATVTAIKLR